MNKHIHLRKVSSHIIAVRNKPHHYGNSRAIWDHTVLSATGRGDIPAFKAGTRFRDPKGMQG